MTAWGPVGTGTVRLEVDAADPAVRVVTLDRPDRLNAITPELVGDLLVALRACHADDAARAVVLTGAGTSFCSGDDLTDVGRQAATPEAAARYVADLQDVTRDLLFGRLPVVAGWRGWAVGGGLEWVVGCDVVVAGQGARGFFPELALGLFPTGGVVALLPRIVGLSRARALLLLGERFDAQQAHAWGLVHLLRPDAEVLPAALDVARRLAALPAAATSALRRALTLLSAGDLEQALAVETRWTVQGFLDPAAAVRAAAALRRGH